MAEVAPTVVRQRKQKATAGTQESPSVTPAKVSKQTAQPTTKEKETAEAKLAAIGVHISRDLAIAELVAVPLTMIVLVLVFGSLIAARKQSNPAQAMPV